jgi:hypothetical protein
VPSRARKACVEGPVLVVERTIDLNAVDNFQVDTRVVVVQSVGIADAVWSRLILIWVIKLSLIRIRLISAHTD